MRSKHGKSFALIMKDGLVHRFDGVPVIFDNLEQAQSEQEELILAIPFWQALQAGRPISGVEQTARRNVSALRVRAHEHWTLPEFLATAPDLPRVELRHGHFDIDDHEYASRAREVVRREIQAGHGSNFVLHRTYRGRISHRSAEAEMSIFSSLLRAEVGAYWTFLIHFPDHSLIGASPEMHLCRTPDGLTTMNPISGTYRYPGSRPELQSLREFLEDEKERNELYMVVDEELKIMTELCETRPWISEPRMHFMSNVAHTEYLIHGYSKRPWTDAFQLSLVAPTILGSPLESAFRMAQRNDASPRNYFGGIVAHIAAGTDHSFDSAILIRTACIESNGDVAIPVGSTIVRDSDPDLEAAETAAKAGGMLHAFEAYTADALSSVANELLEQRASEVAQFWTTQAPIERRQSASSAHSALVIDNEDRFTGMLAAHLESLGIEVSVTTSTPTEHELLQTGLLVLGPGPGDPNDESDPRIVAARNLARWVVKTRKVPTMAVCLSHQLVARELGFSIRRLPRPNQGSQREISLFGDNVRVGFYNSYSAFVGNEPPLGVDIASNPETGEVYALRSAGLRSFQFHPESILSTDGAKILRETANDLLAGNIIAVS